MSTIKKSSKKVKRAVNNRKVACPEGCPFFPIMNLVNQRLAYIQEKIDGYIVSLKAMGVKVK